MTLGETCGAALLKEILPDERHFDGTQGMTSGLVPGWYIILYHDVSWEESPFIRHIGGTCPPDVFRDHVQVCAGLGTLVSIRDGVEKLTRGDIASPLFSFWFDDGFVGVRKYAAPILAARGITGATSICSRFISRSEMFWRCKLSYLQSIDAGRHVRARLRKYGYSLSELVRDFVVDRFRDEVLFVINTLYDETASHAVQEDAFRIFETPDGLIELHKRGWVIANHSAAHYPISEQHSHDMLMDEFEECERFIQSLIGTESNYWVSPFGQHIEPSAISASQKRRDEKHIVLVGTRVNVCPSVDSTRILYRISAPANDRNQLTQALFFASQRSRSPAAA
jgi:peptidoglycan/xylan/chitin deacetylase (PgdA/CDA1 family)